MPGPDAQTQTDPFSGPGTPGPAGPKPGNGGDSAPRPGQDAPKPGPDAPKAPGDAPKASGDAPKGQDPLPPTPANQTRPDRPVAELLVVLREGKVIFRDDCVVVVNTDEILGEDADPDVLLATLKDVARTRENDGRKALTDRLMSTMRARLGLS